MTLRRILAILLTVVGHQLRWLGSIFSSAAVRLNGKADPGSAASPRSDPHLRGPQFWPGERPPPPDHWVERVREGAPWLLEEMQLATEETDELTPPVRSSGRRSVNERIRALVDWLPGPNARSVNRSSGALSGTGAAVPIQGQWEQDIDLNGPGPEEWMRQRRQRAPSAWSRRDAARNHIDPVSMEQDPAGTRQAGLHASLNGAAAFPDAPDLDRESAPEFFEPQDFRRSRPSPGSMAGSSRNAAYLIADDEPDGRRGASKPRFQSPGQNAEFIRRWPALPESPEPALDDWSSTQRMWDRQRRLDAEQRGEVWSGRRF